MSRQVNSGFREEDSWFRKEDAGCWPYGGYSKLRTRTALGSYSTCVGLQGYLAHKKTPTS
jgi:hypothetical protein